MPQIGFHSVLCLQGLGELYEEDFVAATSAGASTAVDKQDAVRQEARNLMKELFGKLDALSHFHYAPKPIIEEMQVRADVPALAMEEVAPQVGPTALCCSACPAHACCTCCSSHPPQSVWNLPRYCSTMRRHSASLSFVVPLSATVSLLAIGSHTSCCWLGHVTLGELWLLSDRVQDDA